MQLTTFALLAMCALAHAQYNAWQSQPWQQRQPTVRQYWPQQQQQNYWPQEAQPQQPEFQYEYQSQGYPWPGRQQTQLFYDQQPSYPLESRFAQGSDEYKAIAKLAGDTVNGNISFTQNGEGPVRVRGTIVGLHQGQYGFHVHQSGDLTGGCLSMLGHFNPDKKDHGAPEDHERHVGDLGNVAFGPDAVAHVDFTDDVITLNPGHKNSIIGRGLVLHSAIDDLGRTGHPDSKKTGNAGSRVACGVIGIM